MDTGFTSQHDYHVRLEKIQDRLQKTYKVRQEIQLEFTETEKIMKRMKEIMEGDPEGMRPHHNDGFDSHPHHGHHGYGK